MKPFKKPGMMSDPVKASELTTIFRDIEQMPFNRSQSHAVPDTGSADTEFAVSHSLGRIPNGFVVTNIDRAGTVYTGSSGWTATTIYLKCSAANAAVALQVF